MHVFPRLFLSFALVFSFFSSIYAQTWIGPAGGSWATGSNWSTGVAPAPAGNVTILSAGPTLDGPKNIASLFIAGTGSINLATFSLTCSGNASVIGGTLSNGTLSAAQLSAFESNICTDLILIHSGGTASTVNGGNTFNGTTEIHLTGGQSLTFGNTLGDTFNGNVTFRNAATNNARALTIANNGRTVITGNAILSASATAGVIIGGTGANTGTCEIQGTIEAGTYAAAATLTLRRVKQVAATPNGVFSIANFVALNDTLNGTFTLTGTTSISLTTSQFLNTCSFSSPSYTALNGNRFATTAGTVSLAKTGAGTTTATGGNTFGPGSITLTGTGGLRLANTKGDTCTSDFTFINGTTNQVLDVSYNGINIFGGNVTLQNSSSAGILFSANTTGRSVITGAILNGGYTAGPLILQRVKQLSTSPNGTFAVTTFTANGDTLNGDISVTTTANLSLTNSFFERNCTFSGVHFPSMQGCRFATTSGTATITKTGAGNTNANGGNTFGTAIITNSATTTNSQLQMSTTTGDTYLGDVSLVNSSTGQLILLSQAGTTTIAGNLSLQNSSTAGIIIGAPGTGRTVLSGILVNGTYSGPLTMRRLKQTGTGASDAFTMTTFTALNDTLNGAFTMTTTGATSLTTCRFENTPSFTAANYTAMAGCSFATTTGTATIAQTGATNSDLAGGNTFGPLIVNHSGVGVRLRFANTTADTYLGNVTLNNLAATSILNICFTGINTIAGNLTFAGTSTAGTFVGNGAAGGTTVLSGVLIDGGYASGAITLNRVKQTSTAANGPFSIANFTALSDTLSGDISVTTSAAQSLTNSIFERNCTFVGGQIPTLSGNQFSTLAGTTAITKTGINNNTPAGGNTFVRDATISNTGTGQLLMSNTNGDTYQANATFVNTSVAASLNISWNGTTTVAGNVNLQNSSTGGISLGQSATLGRTVITGRLVNIAYTGPLTLRKVRQVSTTANDAFSLTAFTALNDTLSGDINVTTSAGQSLTNSIFERNCTFVGAQITELRGCSLATVSGTATVTKTGNGGNTPYGGNTFGPAVITLDATATAGMILSNTAGDTYLADVTFANLSAGSALTISWNGATTVAGNVHLQNSSTNGIAFGQSATVGRTTITGRLVNIAYTGPLTLRKVRQVSTTANDAFSVTSFTTLNDTLSGDISVTTSAGHSLTNSIFERNCTFIGAQIAELRGCSLATVSGTAIVTKTGSGGNTPYGGNTFGTAVITLAATAGAGMTMANTAGDTYLADATFVNAATAANSLIFSNAGRTTVAGNVNLQNSSAGGITIGPGSPATGTTLINGTIQNLGYASGPLNIRRTRQMSASANGTFAPTAFAANADTLSGDITINATASINLNGSWFETSCTLTAPVIGSMVNCKFSVLSGTTILTKTGTTGTDDAWAGNNRFGNVVITNATTRYIRMANAAASPDTFMAGTTATFVRTGTGTLTPAYTSNMRVEGNISTAGSTGAITFGRAGNGRVLIEGNAAQTFTGGGAATTFALMTMNTTGTFSLNNNLNIGTDVTFTAGKVVTSALGLLILNAGSTATGASNASFVDGPVRKIGNTAFTYPTGDGSTYGPCALTGGGAATDHYTAEYFLADPNPTYNTSSYDFPLQKVSEVEYWEIQRTNGGGTPGLTLFWGPHSGGVNDPASLMVVRWGGASWGSMGNGATTGDPANGSISTGGLLSTFGIFSFGSNTSGNQNLPVVLSQWQAEKLGNQVLLSWQTAMEENVSHFEIERSGDNIAFSGIGQVQATGNSSALQDYAWTDPTPLPGASYYRLRMVDVDGQLALSEILTVTRGDEGEATASFYPNPVQDYIHVTSSSMLPRNTRIALLDQQGKHLGTVLIEQAGYSFDMDTRELPSGIYLLRFDTEFAVPAVRFVIER